MCGKNAILLDIDEYCHDAKADHVVNCCDAYAEVEYCYDAEAPVVCYGAEDVVEHCCIFMHFTAFLCISLRFSAFLCISMHFSSLHLYAFHCISLHLTAFHCISLHFTAFHCISLHFTAFLCISLHFSACFFIYLIFLISLICLGVCASYFKECVPHTFRSSCKIPRGMRAS